MPDEQANPQTNNADNNRRHPLLDAPPPPQNQPEAQQKRVNIPFPETANVPRWTYILIAINVGIWLLRYLYPQGFITILNWGILDVDAVIAHREIYRLVTAMFLHIEMQHLLFNCLAIYYIGRYVERFFGHTRFLIIYFLGGLAGSTLSLFLGEGGLGASGAVMAIWGAEAVFWYQHRQLFGSVALSRLRWSGIVIFFNFVLGFTANAAGTANIGNFAHLGGLLGGSLLAWFIGPRFLAVAVKDSQEGQLPVRVLQVNPLMRHVRDILFYSAGLAALLLLAIVVSS